MMYNRSLFLAWFLSFIATLLSILVGEVLGYEPCPLCWYQRICLFPLPVILVIAIYRRDREVSYYVIPQVFIGMMIALYQFAYPILLPYLGIIPICTYGKDCTISPFEFFGFINLPFISFLGFLALFILLLISLLVGSDTPNRTHLDSFD